MEASKPDFENYTVQYLKAWRKWSGFRAMDDPDQNIFSSIYNEIYNDSIEPLQIELSRIREENVQQKEWLESL